MKSIKLTFIREDDAHDMYHSTAIQSMIASKDISVSYNNTHPNELIINSMSHMIKECLRPCLILHIFIVFIIRR